jgi:hypothetical protein
MDFDDDLPGGGLRVGNFFKFQNFGFASFMDTYRFHGRAFSGGLN